LIVKKARSTSLIVFLAVAFGIAIAIGVLIFANGGFIAPLTLPALLTMMFSPALGAILATKLVEHRGLRTNGITKANSDTIC
jgi:hypothetical protein